jgi:hypothetical protein
MQKYPFCNALLVAKRLHNLPLRCKPESRFAPTEMLKIATLTRAA